MEPKGDPLSEASSVLFKEECFAIQGAVFEVYREMGCGFLESVYQECLTKEFQLRGIPFVPNSRLSLQYKGARLNQFYRADFVCYNEIIVEIKSVEAFCSKHKAQLLNYLRATDLRMGLLVNFGDYPKASIHRIVR